MFVCEREIWWENIFGCVSHCASHGHDLIKAISLSGGFSISIFIYVIHPNDIDFSMKGWSKEYFITIPVLLISIELPHLNISVMVFINHTSNSPIGKSPLALP